MSSNTHFTKICVIIASIVILPLTSVFSQSADEPLISARPGFGEVTTVVPPGQVYVEGGYGFDKAGNIKSHNFGGMLIRIGLGRRMELGLSPNTYILTKNGNTDIEGFGDAAINTRINLTDGSDNFDLFRPAAGILLSTSIPSGSSAYRNSKMQPSGVLALAWGLNGGFDLWSALGFSLIREQDNNYKEFSTVFGLGRGVSEKTWAYFEFMRVFDEDEYSEDTNHIQAGMTYLQNNNLQFDLFGGKNLSSGGSNYFLGCGLAYRVFTR